MNTEANVRFINDMLEIQYPMLTTKGDIKRWLAAFTEDVVYMPPNLPVLKGKKAMQHWAQAFFPNFDLDMSVRIQSCQGTDQGIF